MTRKRAKPGAGLDLYEEALAERLKPLPHGQVIVCRDGTIASFVGPHALILAQLFLATIQDEGLI